MGSAYDVCVSRRCGFQVAGSERSAAWLLNTWLNTPKANSRTQISYTAGRPEAL